MARFTCLACDGDGFAPTGGGSCPICHGAGKVERKRRRLCMPCEKWVPLRERECKACGAETDLEPIE